MLQAADWQTQKKIRALIASDDPLLAERLWAFLEQGFQTQPIGKVASSRECMEALRNQAPDVLLIAEGLSGANVLDMCREAIHVHPRVAPIILAQAEHATDSTYLHTALDMGVCGVIHVEPPYADLRFQNILDSVVQAYNLIQERISGVGGGIGRIVSFFGLKGGVGKTTVAANLAWILSAQEERQRVILADFNWHYGSLDACVGHVASQSVLDLIPVLDAISRTDVENVAPPLSDYLRLLSAPLDSERLEFTRDLLDRMLLEDDRASVMNDLLTRVREQQTVQLADAQLDFLELLLKKEKVKQLLSVLARRTLQSLRRNYHYVVADTAARLDDVTLSVLELSDLVLLVCTPDVPSIRATRAALTMLGELGVSRERIGYVINRASRRAEVRAADIRGLFVGYELLGEIPADFESIQPFANAGALIAQSGPPTQLTRSLYQLAAHVAEQVPVGRAA